uniref:Putative secreted protein n=1 Tax=Anopheles darlingi TaxID=43151 RepID=A0A2M4DIV9_ANODA
MLRRYVRAVTGFVALFRRAIAFHHIWDLYAPRIALGLTPTISGPQRYFQHILHTLHIRKAPFAGVHFFHERITATLWPFDYLVNEQRQALGKRLQRLLSSPQSSMQRPKAREYVEELQIAQISERIQQKSNQTQHTTEGGARCVTIRGTASTTKKARFRQQTDHLISHSTADPGILKLKQRQQLLHITHTAHRRVAVADQCANGNG